MHPSKRTKTKTKTIWLPAELIEESEQFLKEHTQALKTLDIDNDSRLIRWWASLGKPKAQKIIEAIEKMEKEET